MYLCVKNGHGRSLLKSLPYRTQGQSPYDKSWIAFFFQKRGVCIFVDDYSETKFFIALELFLDFFSAVIKRNNCRLFHVFEFSFRLAVQMSTHGNMRRG